jgi:hypothetical protein
MNNNLYPNEEIEIQSVLAKNNIKYVILLNLYLESSVRVSLYLSIPIPNEGAPFILVR